MLIPSIFRWIVAFANVWEETGWNAIIYLSAITAIDPSLYEAASIDGAGRWAKIRHITFPGIKPTIMILLLMNVGNVLNAGFEVQYLLGNGLVQSVSQTIDIYVLKWGISQGDYAIGTAAGIFNKRSQHHPDCNRKPNGKTHRRRAFVLRRQKNENKKRIRTKGSGLQLLRIRQNIHRFKYPFHDCLCCNHALSRPQHAGTLSQ